jgi:rhodanese-related sulfurtransferase
VAYEVNGVTQYSIDEVKEILKNGKAKVIDVRTPEEYQEGHIPGVPLRVMQNIAEWIGELNPEEPYVFVCRSGGRSQTVAEYLVGMGFHNVANCVGGMLAWNGDIKTGSDA